MSFVIAVARVEDVSALIQSAESLFREDGGRRDPFVDANWPTQKGHDYYMGMITNPKSLVLLARRDSIEGEVVGHLTGQIKAPNELRPNAVVAELVSLRVMENERGHGVGAKLVDDFFAWAKTQEANQATVSAYASNTDAIRFYQAQGFESDLIQLKIDL
ncbi:GNAT family N-acetyltransferase [Nonomuraea sp. NPDC050786]|uniref:GNAT family N-acetyltransferase n=1 Tax=Nonomuraea sp. NPDC050786 TaxID=3154840 RepID=UPI00340FF340